MKKIQAKKKKGRAKGEAKENEIFKVTLDNWQTKSILDKEDDVPVLFLFQFMTNVLYI